MIKVIPAVAEKTIYFCDKCEKETKVPVNLRGDEPLQDMRGITMGSNKIKFDLCLDCFYDIKKIIEGK